MRHTRHHRLLGLVSALATGSVVGCAVTPTHRELSAFLKDYEHLASGIEARVGPGDRIDIESPRIQELDGRDLVVQADGRVSARLIGEVRVVGMTAREIASKFEELYAPYYREPFVHVTISDHSSSVFYVFGQVSKQGPFRHTGRDTVLSALSEAQPNQIAWKKRVRVIRPNHLENEIRTVELDLDKIVKHGDTKLNLMLEPGDIVFVPPTPLGWVGLRFRELLFPVGPALQTYATPARAITTQRFYDEGQGNIGTSF